MDSQIEFDLKACFGCGRCKEVCPAGIDIPKMLSLYRTNKDDSTKLLAAEDCIECGVCTAHCEKGLPVKEIIRKIAMMQCEQTVITFGYN